MQTLRQKLLKITSGISNGKRQSLPGMNNTPKFINISFQNNRNKQKNTGETRVIEEFNILNSVTYTTEKIISRDVEI